MPSKRLSGTSPTYRRANSPLLCGDSRATCRPMFRSRSISYSPIRSASSASMNNIGTRRFHSLGSNSVDGMRFRWCRRNITRLILAKRRRSNACAMDCGFAGRANFSMPSCSLLSSSSSKSRGSGLKSLPLRGLAAKPLFSAALTNWNGRCTRHVLIAARSSHLRKVRITAAAQEASRCIEWHQ